MNTTQTQLKEQKDQLVEEYFSGNLTIVELNKMRRRIIRISNKITPEATPALKVIMLKERKN